MDKAQENFILEQLDMYRTRKINNYTLKNISTDKLRYILEERFDNGPDMEAVLCLFEKIIFTTATSKNENNNVLYTLSSDINNWITNINKLSVISREGIIYYGNILSQEIKILIKIPKKEQGFNSLLREYFIGLNSINKLRYIIPTFVYTLSAFLCSQPYYDGDIINTGELCNKKDSEKTIYVIYENIPGDTLTNILSNNDISFEEWLDIFIQVLLSLEIAQREIGFTHFDLHTSNVMIRKTDIKYDITLDNLSYNIHTQLLPVIIDFGTSCVFVQDRYIGSSEYMPYRMLNFIVSGYDMYKFLVYSSLYAKSSLSKKIRELFKFYGNNDPYYIISSGSNGIKNASKTFCSKVTDSFAATYTPLMFLEWIKKKYNKIVSKNIKISTRTQYKFLKYSSTVQEYKEFINNNIDDKRDAVELIEKCIDVLPSYILNKYNINILEKYNISNKFLDMENVLIILRNSLSQSENVLLMLDMTTLENVFDIVVPTQSEITEIMDSVLRIPILWKKVQDKLDVISKIRNISYHKELKPYLQLYYTILELKLEDKFYDWIKRFQTSNIYKFYLKNEVKLSQSLRWSKTLRASIVI